MAPTVARLLSVVADELLLAILMAAAPAPLVEALPDVTPEVTSCAELPIPVTAVAVSVPVLMSVPAPLPWIDPVRAVSVIGFALPAFRTVTAGALELVVAPLFVPVKPWPEKSGTEDALVKPQ